MNAVLDEPALLIPPRRCACGAATIPDKSKRKFLGRTLLEYRRCVNPACVSTTSVMVLACDHGRYNRHDDGISVTCVDCGLTWIEA